MTHARITVDFLRHFLNAWHLGELMPDEALDFRCLDRNGRPNGRAFTLYELLEAHIEERLHHYRRLYLPANWRTFEPLEIIRRDACAPSMALQSWSALYYRYFYADGVENTLLMKTAAITERRLQRRIQESMKRLTHHLKKLEAEAERSAHQIIMTGQMVPPLHRRLFGVDTLLTDLMRVARQADAPAFISIEGLGGIGKSTLAWELVNRLRQSTERPITEVIWLSAKQETLSETGDITPLNRSVANARDVINQLFQRILGTRDDQITYDAALLRFAHVLAHQRYLVVIDNLETLDDAESLLPRLYPLSNGIRFILTSRVSLRHLPYTLSVQLKDLNIQDGQAMLLAETRSRNPARNLTSADTLRVYETVGGVPLALRLVAAQLATIPTDTVLEQLLTINATQPEERHERLFTYIYRRTWQMLDEPAQRLLLVMAHISDSGTTFEALRQRAIEMNLSQNQFGDALRQLQDHALLEIVGSEPRYSLHRLTITFLRTEIIRLRWQMSS